MIDPPKMLRLNAALSVDTGIREIFDFAVRHVAQLPDIAVSYWTTSTLIKEKGDFQKAEIKGAPGAGDFDELGEAHFSEGFSIMGKLVKCYVKPIRGAKNEKRHESFGLASGWRLSVQCTEFEEMSEDAFVALAEGFAGILRALAAELPPLRAELSRDSSSFLGPVPPLAEPEVIMSCLLTDLVAQHYADDDGFWSAWDRVEYLGGGLALAERGLGLAAEADFKARSLKSGMAMARAAKPGLAQYYLPDPSPAEQKMLDASPSYLEPVGYKAADKSVEFTAYVPEDDHLGARDIFTILQLLEFGMADGQAVEQVVVTFPSRAAAEAEAAPLRAVGARVQYLDSSGEWLVLEP